MTRLRSVMAGTAVDICCQLAFSRRFDLMRRTAAALDTSGLSSRYELANSMFSEQ